MREFSIFKRPVSHCRLCRKRKAARDYARNKAANARLKDKLVRRSDELEQREATERLQHAEKFLRHIFMTTTAGTRQRIRVMAQNEKPKPKTIKALAKRREILARYEAAYQTQLRILRTGETPPALRDMVKTGQPET